MSYLCLGLLLIVQSPAKALGEELKSILAFGDSLTEGCDVHLLGNSACGWVDGVSWGYPAELQTILNENNHDIVVYNHGIGGETTAEGVNRIDSVLDTACSQGAEYILILEGTNDLLFHKTWQQVLFNLTQMVKKSRARGVEPLVATLTPDPEHSYKDIPLMNYWLRDWAVNSEVAPVVLVDLYNAVAPYWSSYTNPRGCYNDQLHPNLSGFNAIAATWYASLSDLLAKPRLPWLMLLLGAP